VTVLVQFLAIAAQRVATAHAFMSWHVIERAGAAFADLESRNARTFDDHARHVVTHGERPWMG